MRKIFLVIAGNYDQYRSWLNENWEELGEMGYTHKDIHYISDYSKLLGYTADAVEVVFYGTWEEREDASSLREYVKRILPQKRK